MHVHSVTSKKQKKNAWRTQQQEPTDLVPLALMVTRAFAPRRKLRSSP